MRQTRTAQTSLFDVYSQHKFSDMLDQLSQLLDVHPQLLNALEADLLNENVRPTGREGLSVESIFRCMLPRNNRGQTTIRNNGIWLSRMGSYFVRVKLERVS